MKLRSLFAVLGLGALVTLAAVAGTVEGRVRARILLLKVRGRLEQVSRHDLVELLRLRSPFDLPGLAITHNPYAALRLPRALAADSTAGRTLFASRCSSCHGLHAEGGVGPSLVSSALRHGSTDWAMYRVMQDGVPGTAMQPMRLSFEESWQVIAYLRNQQRAAQGSTGHPAATVSPLTTADLEDAGSQTAEWRTHYGDYAGHRNRDIPELTVRGLETMRLAWAYQMPADPPYSQATPLAVRGLVLTTTAEDVIALRQDDGSEAWRYHRDVPSGLKLCCLRANRGVAVLGQRVFYGTLDAHLIALDLATGRQLWDVAVAPWEAGYSVTGAPLAVDGKIVIGVGGGEFGVRGLLDAYDPGQGTRLWRFHTIPLPGEPGGGTWPAEALPQGGGGTWVVGAYDVARHLLIWGVGNPAPTFAPELRRGDNLYTCSVVALDVRTGQLRWSYQFTPNDSHDWDSAQSPVLVDAPWQGRVRPLLLWANRNGFFYVLDRSTGEFLRATPYARQTWNDGFDAAGHPRLRPGTDPSASGVVVFPGASGATNWWPPSYADGRGLLFVSMHDHGDIYLRDPGVKDEMGQSTGGRSQPAPGTASENAVVALDLATGAIRWRAALSPTYRNWMGGLLSLGDRLVLGAYGSELFALDAASGRRVWQRNLGGTIAASPVVFRTGGKPRLAITAGSVLFVFEAGPADAPLAGSRMEARADAR